MNVARIRIRIFTVKLHGRTLDDDTGESVDIIDVPLEPGEYVLEIETKKQPAYVEKWTEPSKEMVRDGYALPGGKLKQHRDPKEDFWRVRATTVQMLDDVVNTDYDSDKLLDDTPDSGEPVLDAEVMGELEPGDG